MNRKFNEQTNMANKSNKLLAFVIWAVVLSSIAYAIDLPPGLLKIQEYNANLAQEFLQNISFVIAFLAGMTSIFSPCILPLLPAYFAITFKEKKKITLATFIFFLGFALVFVLMGLLATLTGKSLISVFGSIGWLIPAVGIALVIFGIMIFLGKGFPGINVKRKSRNDAIGIFLAGAFFAVGWTACTGPIISGVLLMTATFGNYVTSSYLMFAYSLGIFVPLFILSFFYDKLRIDKVKWLNKETAIKIAGKKFHTSIPNIIAGILFIFLGIIFIFFKGTSIFNGLQMFGLKQYFYSWQNSIIGNVNMFNIIGIVIFSAFILVLGYFLVKEIRDKKE